MSQVAHGPGSGMDGPLRDVSALTARIRSISRVRHNTRLTGLGVLESSRSAKARRLRKGFAVSGGRPSDSWRGLQVSLELCSDPLPALQAAGLDPARGGGGHHACRVQAGALVLS
jgi:hypothetical protein